MRPKIRPTGNSAHRAHCLRSLFRPVFGGVVARNLHAPPPPLQRENIPVGWPVVSPPPPPTAPPQTHAVPVLLIHLNLINFCVTGKKNLRKLQEKNFLLQLPPPPPGFIPQYICIMVFLRQFVLVMLLLISSFITVLYMRCCPKQCCGSGMFIPDPGSDFFPSRIRIPDPNCLHPGSRIRIKEFKYLNPKKWFISSRKYDPSCSSRIPDLDADFLPIPDPRSRGQKGTGSWIPDPDPQHWSQVKNIVNF